MFELELVGHVPPNSGPNRSAEPVTLGVPLPRGVCFDPAKLTLHAADRHGPPLPWQHDVLDRWSDGSVRWLLADFQADVDGNQPRWRLKPAVDGVQADAGGGVRARMHGDRVHVDAPGRAFVVDPASSLPLSGASVGGTDLIDPTGSRTVVLDSNGRAWSREHARASITTTGPIRAEVQVDEVLVGPDRARLLVTWRIHFWARGGAVRVELTIRNPRRARHPDGYWDLGDAGSILIGRCTVALATAMSGEPVLSLDIGQPLNSTGGHLELLQASSGGAAWNSPVHQTADGRVHLPFRGWRLSTPTGTSSGERANPIVVVRHPDGDVSMAVPQFWQHFPKAISADANVVRFHVFPDAEVPHELQGGEQKTHVFTLGFGPAAAIDPPLDWCRAPLRVRASAAAYAAVDAIPAASPADATRFARYQRLIAPALDGPASFFAKRERIDEYGWRHFGDLYADHEATRHQGDEPLVSHYNNQYDAVAAFARHFMLSGDWRWWDLMDDLARHVVDIDIYHTDEDRAAYNGGLFWHTNHYVTAGTSTHRSYARASGLPGGGPANEHNYTTGLMLHHFLTGSAASAEAVIGLADWVIAMDDGRRSRFRWVDRGPTGQASSTASTDYHGPGRGAANSVVALLDAHRLSGRSEYLSVAEVLIRRVVHPDDDPEDRNLFDVERRWSYTVFLQALADYVDMKSERGERDLAWAYARASLLRYARWMLRREVPYLSRPDRLEFPTETWAAQDLRKADIFHRVLAHADGHGRVQLISRRDELFFGSLNTLASMSTASSTRPLVLVLGNGLRVASQTVPSGPEQEPGRLSFQPPQRFVPQKVRVVRRAAGAAAVLVIVGAAVVWWVL